MDKKELLKLAGIAIGGVGIGYGVGYLITKKRLQSILDKEINSVKEVYEAQAETEINRRVAQVNETIKEHFGENFADQIASQKAAEDLIKAEGYLEGEEPVEPPRRNNFVPPETVVIGEATTRGAEFLERRLKVEETVTTNIFENTEYDNDDVMTNEITTRDASAPYVITFDEYQDDMVGEHEKVTVTYWDGDNVLMDSDQKILSDIEGLIGTVSITRFGWESHDPNVVYVRNEKLGLDFEVIKDDREYAEAVLGIRPQSVKTRPGRMRDDD